MTSETQRSETWSSIGLLILRAGFGIFMITHGWVKVEMLSKGQFSTFGDPIGIGSAASLILVAVAEVLCAALVIAGLATRLASIPIVVAMAVAAFVAHANDPWTMTTAAIRFFSGQSQSWASKQPPLMFLIVFLALIFTGAGRYSVDYLIAARRKHSDIKRKA